jgi:site-specific DNA recombinase
MNPAAAPARRVGIWIRVSTEEQAEGESPEHHEARARYYAQAKGWQVVEVYRLEGVSGKAVSRHPETGRMLEHVQSGHITALLFSKLARLARNTRELLEFSDRFQKHGADLVSLQEAIDTSTPAGRLFYTIIAAMAQWEREEIAERVAASVPVRARLGKPLGGAAPFGYRWDNQQLVPDANEAPVRRLIYELFAEHGRSKTVARLLNEAGHRTRSGAKFSDTTVRRLIEDPTAKGVRRANYTKSLGEGKAWTVKPESEWVFIDVEGIVPEELWQRCNSILIDRKRPGARRPARKAVHLFSGLVFCVCGGKMTVPSNSPKYTCPRCRRKIPTGDLETVFTSQLRAFVFSPDEIVANLAAADDELRAKEELVDSLHRDRGQVVAEMEKLYQLYIHNQISPDGFGSRNRPLEERLAQIDAELPHLQADADILRMRLLSSAEIVSEAQDVYSRWTDLTFEEKRGIVEAITERITVADRAIEIELAYLPSSTELVAEGQHNFTGSSPPPA